MTRRAYGRQPQKSGQAPGTLVHVGEPSSDKATLFVTLFDETVVFRTETSDVFMLEEFKARLGNSWVAVHRLHEIPLEETIGNCFQIHRLVLVQLLRQRLESPNSKVRRSGPDFLAYCMRDIYLSGVNNRLNEIMKVLTVIVTIFMPLTVIAGWSGMNFKYMPELDSPWGYPGVIVVSLVVVVSMLMFFRHKRWI